MSAPPSELAIDDFVRGLFAALERNGPASNLISQDATGESVFIDGTFDLRGVARDLLAGRPGHMPRD